MRARDKASGKHRARTIEHWKERLTDLLEEQIAQRALHGSEGQSFSTRWLVKSPTERKVRTPPCMNCWPGWGFSPWAFGGALLLHDRGLNKTSENRGTMRLGELEFHILNDGLFRLDGGAMFGVIPRPMWERVAPPDDRNRITLAMNSLLIRAAGKWILVETGAGDKWDAKRRDIYAFEGRGLPQQLAERGVRPEQIDIVVNTHLHFDHCGGNTQMVDGKPTPAFPNARYIVQRGEFEHARRPTERDRASYFPKTSSPLPPAASGS